MKTQPIKISSGWQDQIHEGHLARNGLETAIDGIMKTWNYRSTTNYGMVDQNSTNGISDSKWASSDHNWAIPILMQN